MTPPWKVFQDASKNSKFAHMQGAVEPHISDMSARNFFRNAADGMKSGFLDASSNFRADLGRYIVLKWGGCFIPDDRHYQHFNNDNQG